MKVGTAIGMDGRLGRSRSVLRAIVRAPFTAKTWRSVGYLLISLVFAIPAFALPLLAVVSGTLSVVAVGLPLLVGVLMLARFSIRYFRWPARILLGWHWPLPAKRPARALADTRAWRALAYCLLKLPLAAVSLYATLIVLVGGVVLVTSPVWARLASVQELGNTWYPFFDGIMALLLFPWLVRALVTLDRILATALLGPSAADRRIASLESSRATLTADAVTTLRRVERDLHDGTQARLVSVGMTLARVEHRLETAGDLREIAALVVAARQNVTEALDELREIVRGIHPPALDGGLTTALTTLASRCAVPVDVDITAADPPDAVATAVYFTAAELLTNAARHAAATRVRLAVADADDQLRLVVTDDGRGGAAPGIAGTGLAGLARRAEALDGEFTVDSPQGGPTTIAMTLPRG